MGDVLRIKGFNVDRYPMGMDWVPATDYDAAQSTIRELEAERDALRAAQAWQPEASAPNTGYVLVLYTNGIIDVLSRRQYAAWGDVTHWMPLPPAPEAT